MGIILISLNPRVVNRYPSSSNTTNELKTFTYDFDTTGEFAHLENFEIRVVVIDEKPWFVGMDVATLLGYLDTDYAIRAHCKYPELFKPGEKPGLKCGPRGMKFIPESDLYRLVMRSLVKGKRSINPIFSAHFSSYMMSSNKWRHSYDGIRKKRAGKTTKILEKPY